MLLVIEGSIFLASDKEFFNLLIGLELLIDYDLLLLLVLILLKGLSFCVLANCFKRFYCNLCIGVLICCVDIYLWNCLIGEWGEFGDLEMDLDGRLL